MMKFLIIFSVVIVATVAQKPFYAAGDTTYPKLASRFQGRDEQNQSTNNVVQPPQPDVAAVAAPAPIPATGTLDIATAAVPAPIPATGTVGIAAAAVPAPIPATDTEGTSVDLGNRIGETQTGSTTAAPQTSRTTTTTTERIPIDALGDTDLINRIKTWPREKQPFWYLNAQHIEASRNRTVQQMPTIQSRGSFLPSTF